VFLDKKELAEFLIKELRDVKHQILHKVKLEDLTFSQLQLLKSLYHHEGHPASFYAEHLHLVKPNMSKIVSQLVEKSWLERREDEKDKRIHLLYLLPEGRKVLEKNLKLFKKESLKIFDRLDDKDYQKLVFHFKEAFRILKKAEGKEK